MKIRNAAAAALVLLCLCGCGSSANTTDSTTASSEVISAVESAPAESAPAESAAAGEASLKAVYDEIAGAVELPQMVELNDKLLDRYYGVNPDMLADYAGGVDASGVGTDEIVLFKAADESQVEALRQALETRYSSKLDQQENYNADEAEKIRKCKVETSGLYVTLIISNDADTINGIVSKTIG